MKNSTNTTHNNPNSHHEDNVVDVNSSTFSNGTLEIELPPLSATDGNSSGPVNPLPPVQETREEWSTAYPAQSLNDPSFRPSGASSSPSAVQFTLSFGNQTEPTASEYLSFTSNDHTRAAVQQQWNPLSGNYGHGNGSARVYQPVAYPIQQLEWRVIGDHPSSNISPPSSQIAFYHTPYGTTLTSSPAEHIPYFGTSNRQAPGELPSTPSYMEVGNLIRQWETPFPGDTGHYPQSGVSNPTMSTAICHAIPSSFGSVYAASTPDLLRQGVSVFGNDEHYGFQNPSVPSLALQLAGSPVLESPLSGHGASGWGFSPPQETGSYPSRPQQARPKRKTVHQSQVDTEIEPLTSTSGEPREPTENNAPKKRSRRSVADSVPSTLTENSLLFNPFPETSPAPTPIPQLLASPFPDTSTQSNPASPSTSAFVQTTVANCAPVWHSAAPGIDLSPAPVLTGPDDPDSDVLPAANQDKFPSHGEALKLCHLPWEAGTVLLWEDIPPEQQLRAVRRFRLAYPTTSWGTAKDRISLNCRKQKAEKERQEKRKVARKAARDARTSGCHPVVAVSTDELASSGGVPTAVPAVQEPTAVTTVGSFIPLGPTPYDPVSTEPSNAIAVAPSLPFPVPAVSDSSNAAIQALNFPSVDTEVDCTDLRGDEQIQSGSCAASVAPDAEQPPFLPFYEYEHDAAHAWGEPDVYREGPNAVPFLPSGEYEHAAAGYDWGELGVYREDPNAVCESQNDDLLIAGAENTGDNRVDEMNGQDYPPPENPPVSLIGLDVASARRLLGLPPQGISIDAFAAEFAHVAAGDFADAGRDNA
ncbi:hypothetical protein BZA77DRAFT_352497 [Pyronema omphalodes]|nr:hypothetical protein BZA77DRAFT_352497 [Pyronema omphalodes]